MNISDIVFNMFVAMLVGLAAFYVEEVDPHAIASTCFVLVVLIFLSFMVVFAFGVYHQWLKTFKRFDFVICHHKAQSAALARLLSAVLAEGEMSVTRRITRRMMLAYGKRDVLIDSEHVMQLDVLLDTVASRAKTLLVLCSHDVVRQPSCVGEIAIASLVGVPTTLVLLSDFHFPDQVFLDSLREQVRDLKILLREAIGEEMVKEALIWMRGRPLQVKAPLELSRIETQEFIGDLLGEGRFFGRVDCGRAIALSRVKVVCVVDDSHLEGQAAARVLLMLMRDHLLHAEELMPVMLVDILAVAESTWQNPQVPDTTVDGILICTHDCFEQTSVLHGLFGLTMAQAAVLPVIADPIFKIPSPEQRRELIQICGDLVLAGRASAMTASSGISKTTLATLLSAIPSPDCWMSALLDHIFATFAVPFDSSSSKTALQERAWKVAERIANDEDREARMMMSCAGIQASLAHHNGRLSESHVDADETVEKDGRPVKPSAAAARGFVEREETRISDDTLDSSNHRRQWAREESDREDTWLMSDDEGIGLQVKVQAPREITTLTFSSDDVPYEEREALALQPRDISNVRFASDEVPCHEGDSLNQKVQLKGFGKLGVTGVTRAHYRHIDPAELDSVSLREAQARVQHLKEQQSVIQCLADSVGKRRQNMKEQALLVGSEAVAGAPIPLEPPQSTPRLSPRPDVEGLQSQEASLVRQLKDVSQELEKAQQLCDAAISRQASPRLPPRGNVPECPTSNTIVIEDSQPPLASGLDVLLPEAPLMSGATRPNVVIVDSDRHDMWTPEEAGCFRSPCPSGPARPNTIST